MLVFVDGSVDFARFVAAVDAGLPETYAGWPVRFGWNGVPARHWVTVTTLADWLREQVGVDASAGWSTVDWLVTPQQRLLGATAGAVYADDAGTLSAVRARLAWYPDQLWRWLLACQWHRVAQEEAFVARTAEVGDDLGSVVTAGRQVRELMRLALLLARRYAPYQKWLGTAFGRLEQVDDLPARLADAATATSTQVREDALAFAYVAVAERHNRAGLTERLPADLRSYHTRPAQVLMADRFTDAMLATVEGKALRRLPLIGSIDQHADSTDLLQNPHSFRRTAALYADM